VYAPGIPVWWCGYSMYDILMAKSVALSNSSSIIGFQQLSYIMLCKLWTPRLSLIEL